MSRSYLYLPGDAPDQWDEALGRDADSLVVDLEDSVRPEDKESARKSAATWLRTLPADANVWVRINPGPLGHDDAREVAGKGLRGICVAKTESTTQLDALDAVLSTVEADAGLPSRSVAVAALLESAIAVLAAPAIARAPRVVRLQLGEAELQTELGLDPSEDEREFLWLRSQVMIASMAAGLEPPVATISANIVNLDRLRSSTAGLKRLGFRGRACVHPDQVPVVNQVFAQR